jgi:hypothetical protein
MPGGVQDPASLENLHDIVVPGPVPWWPPAPGWYVLGFLVLATAAWLLIRAAVKWRNNRYRRDALEELTRLEQLSRDVDSRTTAIAQAGELLKRVALAVWPREVVAGLSGGRWLEFLQQTGFNDALAEEQTQVLCNVAYCRKLSEQLSPIQVDELFRAAGGWISKHDRSLRSGGSEEGDP